MFNAVPVLIEHPRDIMDAIVTHTTSDQRFALAIVTRTAGGSVRAPGAMMAVGTDGNSYGYLSGGCIDADVILQAQETLENGRAKLLTYGENSPFMDIKLPCGGAIDVRVIPEPDLKILQTYIDDLDARRPTQVFTNEDGLQHSISDAESAFSYLPKLKLRIAGRGADPIALIRVAEASGVETELWSPDTNCLDLATGFGATVKHLMRADDLPNSSDDAATAFVLMFHETEWEPALLEDALRGDAFFVGAVGSQKTHARRREILAARGTTNETIDRIRAPIGLVPSMRDASTLAISAFAEIIEAFHSRKRA